MAAAPAPAATAGDAAPKKKKGKLVPIVAAVVLLAAGGGAAWHFTKKPADPNAPKVEEAHAPVFLPLDVFTVNLRDEQSERYLQVGVNLELKSEADAEKLKAQLPAVRSRILLLLSSQKSNNLLTIEDKSKLGENIMAEVKLIPPLKDVPVHAVHFSAFVIQ